MKAIAVYGSLKKGFYNHSLLIGVSDYLGEGVESGFQLYSLGSYPCAVKTGNPEDKIRVEYYLVDEGTFQRLDRMERAAGYYQEDLGDRGILWVFGLKPSDQPPIPPGSDGVASWGGFTQWS